MSETDKAIPVALMGSPSIVIERLISFESKSAYEALQDSYSAGQHEDYQSSNKHGVNIEHGDGIVYIDDYKPPMVEKDQDTDDKMKVVALFSAEIGGSNCMEPLILGGEVGLPVVDCDCMGRAFPELQQNTPMIYGHPPYPACLADYRGQRAVILYADTAKHLENHFRKVCVDMGCSAANIKNILGRDDILKKTIPHSISRAWRLGRTVIQARVKRHSPVEAIIQFSAAKLLGLGKISDIERKTTGGFARGELLIEGLEDFSGRKVSVKFQNENLVARELLSDGTSKLLACTPDLICLVENDSGEPIPTEEVKYGLRVAVLVLPASPMLLTPEALAVVGPQAFGYPVDEVSFKSVGGYKEYDPVSPK